MCIESPKTMSIQGFLSGMFLAVIEVGKNVC